MSRLANALLDNYAEHYARVNATLEPTCTPRELRWFARNYGAFVEEAISGGAAEILDLGCGTGKLLACLATYPRVSPVGVDISATQIAVAKRALPNVPIECGDGLAFLQRNEGRFGGIICNDVLEHLATLDDCLTWVEAVVQALRPGGFFACRAPNGANVLASYSRYMDLTHYRCFTATSMVQLLEAGGLSNVRPVPLRGASGRESVRLVGQDIFHRAIFYLTGRPEERFFTPNIHAIGYRSRSSAAG